MTRLGWRRSSVHVIYLVASEGSDDLHIEGRGIRSIGEIGQERVVPAERWSERETYICIGSEEKSGDLHQSFMCSMFPFTFKINHTQSQASHQHSYRRTLLPSIHTLRVIKTTDKATQFRSNGYRFSYQRSRRIFAIRNRKSSPSP